MQLEHKNSKSLGGGDLGCRSQKSAFTLVELVVVIVILAILGTISFISVQSYLGNARDAKRLTDVKNLFSKIDYESAVSANIDNYMKQPAYRANSEIVINWSGAYSQIWYVNFETLKEKEENFVDPLTGEPYLFAYSNWRIRNEKNEREWYNFMEFAVKSETKWTRTVMWNYYQMKEWDSPSLFNMWDYYIVNGHEDWEYEYTPLPPAPDTCDSLHLNLCNTQSTCGWANWYWNGSNCVAKSCSNTLSLCTSSNCGSVWWWYRNGSSCQQTASNCTAKTDNWYSLAAANHNETYPATKTQSVSNGTKTYYQTYLCTNGTWSKSWEETSSLSCNTNYVADWW